MESAALPYYHWEILWFYLLDLNYFFYSLLSIIALILLNFVLYKLIRRAWHVARHNWKEPEPGSSYFGFAIVILLGVVGASFILPEFVVTAAVIAPYTVLYGPSWGLGFGWYALIIAGVLGLIYTKVKEIIEKPKEEDWKAL